MRSTVKNGKTPFFTRAAISLGLGDEFANVSVQQFDARLRNDAHRCWSAARRIVSPFCCVPVQRLRGHRGIHREESPILINLTRCRGNVAVGIENRRNVTFRSSRHCR